MSSPASEAHRPVEFAHGGVHLSLLLPASADALIDEAAFARDERLPYWADLWPSAVALARHLLERELPPPPRGAAASDDVSADPILELGCGVGLVSLAVASRGHRALATDFEPEALEWATRNAIRNGLHLPTAMLDWRHPHSVAPARLVLAADVLYEARNAEALATALAVLVSPGGRVLLADPGRRWLEPFLGRMRGVGWRVTTLERRREQGTAPGAAESEVTIVELLPPHERGHATLDGASVAPLP